MTSTRSARALRGALAAIVSTFVALLSHVAGGGEVPGLLGILVPLVLATAVCVPLAGRRLSVIRVSASVIASQVLFHALFVLGSAGNASASSAGSSAGPITIPALTGNSAASILHSSAAATTLGLITPAIRMRSMISPARS